MIIMSLYQVNRNMCGYVLIFYLENIAFKNDIATLNGMYSTVI